MPPRVLDDELVQRPSHPNSAQLKPESVEALGACRANVGKWVVWQSGFAHHRASKTQAYNLRQGRRQKTLTMGLLDPEGDEQLEFRSWVDPDSHEYCVLARLTNAEFRIQERENAQEG